MSRTPHTPYSRSRTPSRVGTPLPHATPSRLIPPVLHSAPSLSSLRVYSHAPTPMSGSPPPLPAMPPIAQGGAESSMSSSSAASVSSTPLDSHSHSPSHVEVEGILVPEPEVEVEVVQGNVAGQLGVSGSVSDEEAKRTLRDQLRRTLSQKHGPESEHSSSANGEQIRV